MSVRELPIPHLVIAASAGSGKTFQLTSHYLRLILRGVPPERILATTFTRKAAAEILARVLTRLARAARDESGTRALAAELDVGATRDSVLRSLVHLTRNLHRLQISTLDGLFSRIATSLHLELGLPPGWKIADESLAARLRHEALRDLVTSGDGRELGTLVRLLSKGEVRQKVFEQIHTSVRENRALWLESDADAWQLPLRPVLSEREVEAAIEALRALPEQKNGHVKNALKSFLESAGAGDWLKVLKSKFPLDASHNRPYQRVDLEPEIAGAVATLARHACGVFWNRQAARVRATFDLLEKFDAFHRRRRYVRRALGFEDVSRTLAERLGALPWSEIHWQLDARTDHILLDEFQDTSLVQWEILAPLAEEILSHGDGSRTFFCVGDRKQSIYGWRSAVPKVFDHVLHLDGVRRMPLDKSWRSARVVIETVNSVFENLPSTCGLPDKYLAQVRLWHENFREHETERTELRGSFEVIAGPAPSPLDPDASSATKESAGHNPPGRRSRASHRRKGEADAALARICAEAAERIAKFLDASEHHTVGVLVRRKKTLARMMHELRQREIEASEEGGVRLDDSPIISAVLSLLRFADRPGDSVARFHVATSPLGPLVGLKGETLQPGDRRIARDIRRRLVTEGYGRVVREWANGLAPACDPASLQRLFRVDDLARAWDADATLRPTDFIAHVEATRVEDPSGHRVRVMTIHGSKGLEFDWVVLPELGLRIVGQPPSLIARRDGALGKIDAVGFYPEAKLQPWFPELDRSWNQYTEERVSDSLSALYVALTRAVHAVTAFVPPGSIGRGSFAGILEGALFPGVELEPGAVLFEAGDPQWFRGKRECEPAKEKDEDRASAATAWTPPKLLPPRRGRVRSHESAETFAPRESLLLGEELNLDDGPGRRLAAQLVRLLAEVEWAGEALPADETLNASLGHGAPSDESARESLLERFHELLAHDEVEPLFRREAVLARLSASIGSGDRDKPSLSRLELRLERARRYVLRLDDRILDATFDRLAVAFSGGQPLAAELVVFDANFPPGSAENGHERIAAAARARADVLRRAAARYTRLAAAAIAVRTVFPAIPLVV